MTETQAKTMEAQFDEIWRAFRQAHPNAKLEYSPVLYPDHAEAWVYVLDLDQFESVRETGKRIEGNYGSAEPPIWIVVRTWSGPWEGGLDETEIRRKRDEFVQRMRARFAGDRP